MLSSGGWHGKAGGRLDRSRACYVTHLGNVLGFPRLVLSWKWEHQIEKLAVIERVLIILGR